MPERRDELVGGDRQSNEGAKAVPGASEEPKPDHEHIVYGSVARGVDDDWSDLDMLVVSAAGRREELWGSRQEFAAHILG